jgi:imidazolonepropionase-like amidohydrolase
MSEDEIRAAVEVAHRAERRVAAHAQGAEGIEAALRAGVDTIEHGFWLTDAAIRMMVDGERALVPTFAAARAMQRDLDTLPEFIRRKVLEVDGPQRDSYARALKAGVRIATGTDAGTPGNPHGNIGLELTSMAELGTAPLDCWRAATAWAADAMGLRDRGRLRKGTRADLVAVPPAALTDVTAFDRPRLVAKRGEVLRRE